MTDPRTIRWSLLAAGSLTLFGFAINPSPRLHEGLAQLALWCLGLAFPLSALMVYAHTETRGTTPLLGRLISWLAGVFFLAGFASLFIAATILRQ